MTEQVDVFEDAIFYKSWEERWIAIIPDCNTYLSNDGETFYEMSGEQWEFKDPRQGDRVITLILGNGEIITMDGVSGSPIYHLSEAPSQKCTIVGLPETRKLVGVLELDGVRPLWICATESVYRPNNDSVRVYIGSSLSTLKKIVFEDLDMNIGGDLAFFTVKMNGILRTFEGGSSCRWEGLDVHDWNTTAYVFKETKDSILISLK